MLNNHITFLRTPPWVSDGAPSKSPNASIRSKHITKEINIPIVFMPPSAIVFAYSIIKDENADEADRPGLIDVVSLPVRLPCSVAALLSIAVCALAFIFAEVVRLELRILLRYKIHKMR